jgi:hypothetical protein
MRWQDVDVGRKVDVGWAKRSVPTINIHPNHGGHGAMRLCPPYACSMAIGGLRLRLIRPTEHHRIRFPQ